MKYSEQVRLRRQEIKRRNRKVYPVTGRPSGNSHDRRKSRRVGKPRSTPV
jgi:hypothetical protein